MNINTTQTTMGWWKSFDHEGGRYLVGLLDVSQRDWKHLGALQRAVVDDFGTLVAVEG